MGPNRFPRCEREARLIVEKSATATLVASELDHTLIVVDTTDGAVALTLPAASHDMQKFHALIVNKGGNNLTVVVAAGYGGVGAGGDTITLAQGAMAEVMCDGDYWYALHHTAAA